jgi:outer membrane protein TolC
MKRFLSASAMLALAASILGAQTALTIDKAVESALAHNVSIERAQIAYDSLGRKSGNAWNILIPSIDAGAGATHMTVSDVNSYYGSLSATLAITPAVIKSIEKAKLDYAAGAITRETAFRDVELSVRKAFYGLLYERDYVTLVEANVATAQKQYEQTLARQRAGLVPEVDLLSAQVTLENLRPTLESARTAFENDQASFKRIIGMDQGEAITLDGTLEDATTIYGIDVSGLGASAPAVVKLEKSLEIAKVQRDATAIGLRTPTFALAYVYKPAKTDVAGSDWENSGYVSASATFALDSFIPVSQDAETIRGASDSVKDVEIQLADARIADRLNRESLLRSIARAQAAIKARTLGVTLAERNYALTEDAYRNGTKELLSLQSASDALESARMSLKNESYALLSAVLDLEYAVGVPFGTLGR